MKKAFFILVVVMFFSCSYLRAQQEAPPPAPDQTAQMENSTILSGTIWLDNKCIGETCQSMGFAVYRSADGMVSLGLSQYTMNSDYAQVPLDVAKSVQKALQRDYPKVTLNSDGTNVFFPLFKAKESSGLLDQAINIMDGIGKAITKYKIVTEHYASQ